MTQNSYPHPHGIGFTSTRFVKLIEADCWQSLMKLFNSWFGVSMSWDPKTSLNGSVSLFVSATCASCKAAHRVQERSSCR